MNDHLIRYGITTLIDSCLYPTVDTYVRYRVKPLDNVRARKPDQEVVHICVNGPVNFPHVGLALHANVWVCML